MGIRLFNNGLLPKGLESLSSQFGFFEVLQDIRSISYEGDVEHASMSVKFKTEDQNALRIIVVHVLRQLSKDPMFKMMMS